MPGKTYPAEVKDRALDLIAAEAAANGGKAPRGAITRAAEEVGAPDRTVWGWWTEQSDEGEKQERTSHFARAREAFRDQALEVGQAVLRSLSDQLAAKKLSHGQQVKLLQACQRVADGDKDGADLVQSINLLVNDADREIPDQVEPPPDLELPGDLPEA